MKRFLFFCCLLMIFGSWAEAAPALQCAGGTRIIARGETPSQIFGKDWKSELLKYGISDPRKMPAGLRICVAGVARTSSTVEPKEFLWKKPGGAPVKGCGRLSEDASNEAAWAAHGIPEMDRQELRRLMASRSFSHRILEPGERFAEMSSCKQGKIVVRKNVVAAWPKETSVPVRIITLSNGKRWAWVRNCSNWLPLPPKSVAAVQPPAQSIPEAQPKSSSVAQAACDEWNIHAGAGIEKSIAQGANTTAAYADVEVGACPFTWKSNAGKTYNEALIVGRGHMADDEYQGWEGQQKLLLAGIGLRQSHKDGSGDLYRAMLGFRSNEGSQGKYSHDVRWNAFALYGTHYRIGRNGEDETHYRWGFVVPLGKAHGHAEWDGSQLDLPEWKGSVEVGVRRFVTRRGEDVRFFGELNGIAIVPDYAGIAPRVGACVLDDTVCALAGVNIGLYPETGVAAAVGIQVNTPGVIRFNRDGTRITQVAQAAEVNGVTFQFSPGEEDSSQGQEEKSEERVAEDTVPEREILPKIDP